MTHHRALWIAVLSMVLTLAFLGTRPIWDPDEGRYTNVALTMLDTGDWLNPKRTHEVGHWTKPPLTYWAIASSVAVLGHNPWAARLPVALSYLFCVWLTWRMARRLAPGEEATAALFFATMVLPFGASQMITTDFVLTACETVAMAAYADARFGEPARSNRWLLLMWAGFALAFMTKGPPALLPLVVLLLHAWLAPFPKPNRLLHWWGALIFVVLALPWYVAVVIGHPGLLEYFLGNEVVKRIASDSFNRHGEWYGWLAIYGPTLLIGTLPWTAVLWRAIRSCAGRIRTWRDGNARQADAPLLLLLLWIAVPLVAFCIARSRMPLYLLPLFVPLALLAARQWQAEGRALPRARWIVLWAVALLGVKLFFAHWPTHKDARAWAEAIQARAPFPVKGVVFVEDMARYGIHLHLNAEIEKISLTPVADSRFNPEYDESLAAELAAHEGNVVYVTKQERWPQVRDTLRASGYAADALGTPYQGRVLFQVRAVAH